MIGGATVGLAIVLALARGRAPALRAGSWDRRRHSLRPFRRPDQDGRPPPWRGLGAVFGDWHVYGLVLVSIAAFWLEQAALQTGALAAAVATTMAFDPLSSLVFGIALFDEAVHDNAIGYALSALRRRSGRPGHPRAPSRRSSLRPRPRACSCARLASWRG